MEEIIKRAKAGEETAIEEIVSNYKGLIRSVANKFFLVGGDKDDLMRISDEFIIFRMNLVNYISALSQKTTRKLWHPIPADAHDRIVHFIKTHCSSPTGPKTMRIKMTRLAQETGLGRRAVSEILNTMQDENLLTFSRGIIEINHIEALT